MRALATIIIFGLIAGCDSDSDDRREPVGVDSPPTISSVSDQTATVNSNAGPVSVTVGDDSTAAGSLVLTASTEDSTVIEEIIVAGDGDTRTVEIVPSENQSGSAVVTLTVADESGLEASTSFNVVFEFEEADFATFTREIFDAPANSEPRSIGELSFTGSADGDFSELVNSP